MCSASIVERVSAPERLLVYMEAASRLNNPPSPMASTIMAINVSISREPRSPLGGHGAVRICVEVRIWFSSMATRLNSWCHKPTHEFWPRDSGLQLPIDCFACSAQTADRKTASPQHRGKD